MFTGESGIWHPQLNPCRDLHPVLLCCNASLYQDQAALHEVFLWFCEKLHISGIPEVLSPPPLPGFATWDPFWPKTLEIYVLSTGLVLPLRTWGRSGKIPRNTDDCINYHHDFVTMMKFDSYNFIFIFELDYNYYFLDFFASHKSPTYRARLWIINVLVPSWSHAPPYLS